MCTRNKLGDMGIYLIGLFLGTYLFIKAKYGSQLIKIKISCFLINTQIDL